MARARTARRAAFRALRAGPYVGVRDTRDATAASSELAQALTNCYQRDAARYGVLLGRPGVTMTQSGAQLGGVGARRVQRLGQWRKISGATTYTYAFVGGKLYTYSFAGDAWTEIVHGMTLSTSATVYTVVLGDQLFVTDGTNTPFVWDGTTFTVCTNCPVLYVQPWVHAGRIFGIKNSERTTLVWCEPNQPNVGYEATIGSITYKNAWTLSQTAQDVLVGGVGLNDRMVVFRPRSTTEIYGLVDTDFASGASRESVSETIGCGAPNAITVVDGSVHFVSTDGRPHVLQPGAQLVAIGDELYESVWDLHMPALSACVSCYDVETGLVVLGVPLNGLDTPVDCWPINADNQMPQGLWTGWGEMTALASVLDADGNTVRLHGGTDGRVYRHGFPRGTLWTDALQSGTVAITHMVRTQPLGWDETTEKYWDRLDVLLRSRTTMTNLTVQPITPYGYGVARTADAIVTGGRYDEAQYDATQYAAEGIDQRAVFGFDAHGRWLQFEVRHQTLGEQFGFLSALASVQDVGSYPTAA